MCLSFGSIVWSILCFSVDCCVSCLVLEQGLERYSTSMWFYWYQEKRYRHFKKLKYILQIRLQTCGAVFDSVEIRCYLRREKYTFVHFKLSLQTFLMLWLACCQKQRSVWEWNNGNGRDEWEWPWLCWCSSQMSRVSWTKLHSTAIKSVWMAHAASFKTLLISLSWSKSLIFF